MDQLKTSLTVHTVLRTYDLGYPFGSFHKKYEDLPISSDISYGGLDVLCHLMIILLECHNIFKLDLTNSLII
jgi:hypothetical protein